MSATPRIDRNFSSKFDSEDEKLPDLPPREWQALRIFLEHEQRWNEREESSDENSTRERAPAELE